MVSHHNYRQYFITEQISVEREEDVFTDKQVCSWKPGKLEISQPNSFNVPC